MSVHLERFATTFRDVASQAGEVHKLVDANADWLRPVDPGALRRYRDYPHAVHNIRRLGKFANAAPAEAATYHPFLVRDSEEGRLLGMATITTGQSIAHPNVGLAYNGSDLDYWLSEKSLHGEHHATAEALMQKSGELALQRAAYVAKNPDARMSMDETVIQEEVAELELSGDDTVVALNRMFAVVPLAHRDRLRGFYLRNLMEQVDEPAQLWVPSGATTIGDIDVSKGNQLAELYYLEQPVTA